MEKHCCFHSIDLCLIEVFVSMPCVPVLPFPFFKSPNLLNQLLWLVVKFRDVPYKHSFAANIDVFPEQMHWDAFRFRLCIGMKQTDGTNL